MENFETPNNREKSEDEKIKEQLLSEMNSLEMAMEGFKQFSAGSQAEKVTILLAQSDMNNKLNQIVHELHETENLIEKARKSEPKEE